MKKIGTILFCAALAALTYAGGTAHSLTVGEGFVDPLGFHDSTPTFSWKLPVGVEKQTAYRIEVRGDEIVWIFYSVDPVDYISLVYFSLFLMLPLILLAIQVMTARDKRAYRRASTLIKLVMLFGIFYSVVVFYLVSFKY